MVTKAEKHDSTQEHSLCDTADPESNAQAVRSLVALYDAYVAASEAFIAAANAPKAVDVENILDDECDALLKESGRYRHTAELRIGCPRVL